MIVNNCVRCGCNADTLYHVDGAKSITEWVCGNCAIGYAIPKTDHLAAIKELTDRIAQVEMERDRLADELTNTRVSRDSANDRADRAEREIQIVADIAHWGGINSHTNETAMNEIRRETIKRFNRRNPYEPRTTHEGGGE